MKYRQRYSSPAPYGELSYGAYIQKLLGAKQAVPWPEPTPPSLRLLAPVNESSQ